MVAVGGNALAPPGRPVDLGGQEANVTLAAASLAAVADGGHRLVVTHGNGPQVGMLAEAAARSPAPLPLDVLDAETQGQIGYQLELALRNALPGRELASLLTQVEVSLDDPAFARPTKPIGPYLDRVTADAWVAERSWTVTAVDDGRGPSSAEPAAAERRWRRVVASPRPLRTIERDVITRLVDADVIVICSGGGGIPVTRDQSGQWRGVEAVVDKDRAAAVLAVELDAEALVIVTDVDGVYRQWATPEASLIGQATVGQLRSWSFDPGSMGPKVEAACSFAERTGRTAHIGALACAPSLLSGTTGTRVTP